MNTQTMEALKFISHMAAWQTQVRLLNCSSALIFECWSVNRWWYQSSFAKWQLYKVEANCHGGKEKLNMGLPVLRLLHAHRKRRKTTSTQLEKWAPSPTVAGRQKSKTPIWKQRKGELENPINRAEIWGKLNKRITCGLLWLFLNTSQWLQSNVEGPPR